jgi:hypothetical protein
MLLFNWCGYRWVINLVQEQADSKLEAKLDNNDYDESQLIEIKIPINMPYQTSWADFERYDGAIEVNGIHYKYVKRKIENGQLVLKCIANETKQRLQTAGDDFFKLVNDLQQDHSAKKSNSTVIKNALGDYDEQQTTNVVACQTIVMNTFVTYQSHLVTNNYHLTPEQPPEA